MPLQAHEDQSEIEARIRSLEHHCAVLAANLRVAGGSVPPAPSLITGNSVYNFNALEAYHDNLAWRLGQMALQGNAKTSSAIPAGSQTVAQPNPSAPAQISGSVVSQVAEMASDLTAKLTKTEIAKLTWTERVQLAKGDLSTEKAHTLIAERFTSEGKAESAQAKAPTLTEKVLARKGCKTLAEAALKPYIDPLD